MDLGMKLTLIVLAVILLGAALFVFTNIEKIQYGKKDKNKDKDVAKKETEEKIEETKN